MPVCQICENHHFGKRFWKREIFKHSFKILEHLSQFRSNSNSIQVWSLQRPRENFNLIRGRFQKLSNERTQVDNDDVSTNTPHTIFQLQIISQNLIGPIFSLRTGRSEKYLETKANMQVTHKHTKVKEMMF